MFVAGYSRKLTSYRSWQVVSLLDCVLDTQIYPNPFTVQIAWPLTESMSAATANFPSGFFSTSVIFREMSKYISVYITGPITKTGFILSYFLHIPTSVVQWDFLFGDAQLSLTVGRFCKTIKILGFA